MSARVTHPFTVEDVEFEIHFLRRVDEFLDDGTGLDDGAFQTGNNSVLRDRVGKRRTNN